MPVADGRTDGRTDGTEFIGPLSALPGVQKAPLFKFERVQNISHKFLPLINGVFDRLLVCQKAKCMNYRERYEINKNLRKVHYCPRNLEKNEIL